MVSIAVGDFMWWYKLYILLCKKYIFVASEIRYQMLNSFEGMKMLCHSCSDFSTESLNVLFKSVCLSICKQIFEERYLQQLQSSFDIVVNKSVVLP